MGPEAGRVARPGIGATHFGRLAQWQVGPLLDQLNALASTVGQLMGVHQQLLDSGKKDGEEPDA